MNAYQFCENCGQGVLVMIQKNTGFCTPKCQEQHEGMEARAV